MKQDDIITVTLPRYPGHLNVYKIITTKLKDDCFGTIKLEMIKEVRPQTKDRHYKQGERFTIVEELWFNVPTYRTVKYNQL